MTLESMVLISWSWFADRWLSESHCRMPEEGVEGRSQGTVPREILVDMIEVLVGLVDKGNRKSPPLDRMRSSDKSEV